MKKKLPFFGALALSALLMLYPAEAFEAAFQAMCTWATSFAPSLFPFFLLIPALSCDEALTFYEKILGRVLPALFALPGRAASALCVGLLAGSPAGSIAAGRVMASGGFSVAQGKRLAIFTSGLSPLFLLSAVGVGLFMDRAIGAILLRANLFSLLATGFALKFAFRRDEDVPISPSKAQKNQSDGGILASVLQLAGVCGHMVLFATIAKLIATLFASPSFAAPILAVLEVAGGLNELSQFPMSPEMRVVLYSALCGFSGACVMVQNRLKLRFVPLKAAEFAGAKLIHGSFCALFARLQLWMLPLSGSAEARVAGPLSPVIAAAVVTLLVSTCVFLDLRKDRGKALPK